MLYNRDMTRDSNQNQYQHQSVEGFWKAKWQETSLNQTDIRTSSKEYYNLMMFPYPSAEGLHVGNMYAFSGSDIFGRYKRMQGYEVFEPIGLDGFGIHSENYAFKIGKHPAEQAEISQTNFYNQLSQIGAMFDWSRRLETYAPTYYHWTQWLFIQMFKNGLAYRAHASVNWCPGCKTVIADEQVIEGACERCGKSVESRKLEQWFFSITSYADRLLSHLPTLDWSPKVKIAQERWIGKISGVTILYPIVGSSKTIDCWTAHPNTNYGATFIVLSPDHPAISDLTIESQKREVKKYIETQKTISKDLQDDQTSVKTGVFTGSYAMNHLTGKRMPIYLANFVLSDVGTGAVVGVPAHDERDFAFARVFDLPSIKVVDFSSELHSIIPEEVVSSELISQLGKAGFYTKQFGDAVGVVVEKRHAQKYIEILQKVLPEGKYIQVDGVYSGIITSTGVLENRNEIIQYLSKYNKEYQKIWPINREAYPFCYTGSGTMVDSGIVDGMDNNTAIKSITKHIVQNHWGIEESSYHLRDWLISRQRYWGPPIPMVYCGECAKKGKSWFTTQSAENHKQLSNTLPSSWNPAGWYPVPEPSLPVILPFIDDYKPGDDGVAPLAKHEEFFRTTCPGCGKPARRETDVSDTFLDSSWYFLRYPSSDDNTQPFDPEITRKWLPVDMYTGGAEHSVLHLMYSRFVTMVLHDMGLIDFEEPFSKFFAHGLVIKDGAKMSKSKGNVVNPDEYIRSYGADALRLYLMFMGPFSDGGDFRDAAMEGMSKWLRRVWRMVNDSLQAQQATLPDVHRALQFLIKKVGRDIEDRKYNTAIAACMEFTNYLHDHSGVMAVEDVKTFIQLLAPFAPFMTEELWQRSNGFDRESFTPEHSVHRSSWPTFDPHALIQEETTVIVQVNGKLRGTLRTSPDIAAQKGEIERLALSEPRVKSSIASGKVKKIIFVPGKLINFVI